MHRDLHSALFTAIAYRIARADQYANETKLGVSGLHHPADYYIYASESDANRIECGSRFNLIPSVSMRSTEVDAYVNTYIIPYEKSSLRDLIDFAETSVSMVTQGNGLLVKAAGIISDAYIRREIDDELIFPGEPTLVGLVLSVPVDGESIYSSLTKAVHIDFDNYTVKSDHGRLLDTFPEGIMLGMFWQRVSYYTGLTLNK